MRHLVFAALAAILLTGIEASENTGTNVASKLRICYNTTELHDHDQRLPATMNMLIDLVRTIEDSASNLDARTIAIQIAHRFRQDGIQKSKSSIGNNNPAVLPYSPKGKEVNKNKLMLDRLLPDNNNRFREDALTTIEQCAMHFMMSNTMEQQIRGDEANVCKHAAQYRRRVARETENEAEDLERTSDGLVPRSADVYSAPSEISDCPVENGVVFTKWGAVQAGTVLAGIAAGYETQVFQHGNYQVDSKYAVTLAGDLVEVALLEISGSVGTIGARGGFNSTLAPHWYFKDGKSRVYLTNPELRADLDGLIIASNVIEWSNKYRGMKVSQILDAYYSNRGVFSSEIKACNRNKFSTTYAPQEKLTEQIIAFAEMYNNYTTFDWSPTSDQIDKLSKEVVSKYSSKVADIADVRCDEQDLDRTATDLIVVVDTTWSYDYIHRTVSYLLDNLDINKYESNYTVVNAKDGSIMVNSTWSIAKFGQGFNRTVYDQSEKGWDSGKSMTAVEKLHEERARLHKEKSKLNGKSSTVLLMPKSTDSSQGSFVRSRFTSVMDNYYPGTQYVLLGTGSTDVYSSFVRNSATDIFVVPEYLDNNEESVKKTLNTLIARLREAPRKIINPKCGSTMSGDTSSDAMEVYVEPGTTNNYKVSRNYLSGEGTKTLKFRSQAQGQLTICKSQNDEKPTENCEELGTGEKIIQLSSGSDFNFALVAGPTKDNSNVRCSDNGCRFTDNLKVTVQIDGFTCSDHSAGVRINSSFGAFVVVIALYLVGKLY